MNAGSALGCILPVVAAVVDVDVAAGTAAENTADERRWLVYAVKQQ